MKIFKSQRGDTIAEVLISVAVLSLILSISYALANRATLGNRQSQERSEAQKINNTQIELLKAYLAQPGKEQPAPAVTGDEKAFCIKSSDMSLVKNPATSSDCKTGTDSRYATKIVLADGSYIATTEWDRINGQGKDTLKTAYKVYATNGSAPDLTGTTTGGVGGCAQPALYESNGSACLPIPPNIYVTVKKIPPNSDKTTASCFSAGRVNKSGISVLLNPGGFTMGTDASSGALFSGLEPSTTYTATYTLPNDYKSCGTVESPAENGSKSASLPTKTPLEAAGKTYSIDFLIAPVCTGSANTPQYDWVNVIDRYDTTYSIGSYIKSHWYNANNYPFGTAPQHVTMPQSPDPEGLAGRDVWRWANGNTSISPRVLNGKKQYLYDFYYVNSTSTAVWVSKWQVTGYTDTRTCPS